MKDKSLYFLITRGRRYLLAYSLCLWIFPTNSFAQTIELKEIDVFYGNQVIRGQHQVVVSSPLEVDIIPAANEKELFLGPNVVIDNDNSRYSYIDNEQIAEREKEIYTEVNRRTEESPFTVLFTGNIPQEIQDKRLQLMPEVGVFGDQLEKLRDNTAQNITQAGGEEESEDVGFTPLQPGERVIGEAPEPIIPDTPGSLFDNFIGDETLINENSFDVNSSSANNAPAIDEATLRENEALLESIISGE